MKLFSRGIKKRQETILMVQSQRRISTTSQGQHLGLCSTVEELVLFAIVFIFLIWWLHIFIHPFINSLKIYFHYFTFNYIFPSFSTYLHSFLHLLQSHNLFISYIYLFIIMLLHLFICSFVYYLYSSCLHLLHLLIHSFI